MFFFLLFSTIVNLFLHVKQPFLVDRAHELDLHSCPENRWPVAAPSELRGGTSSSAGVGHAADGGGGWIGPRRNGKMRMMMMMSSEKQVGDKLPVLFFVLETVSG